MTEKRTRRGHLTEASKEVGKWPVTMLRPEAILARVRAASTRPIRQVEWWPVLASLAELELELGRKRRSAAREARRLRGQAPSRSPEGVGCLQSCSSAAYACQR
jgi:hypothetical protein